MRTAGALECVRCFIGGDTSLPRALTAVLRDLWLVGVRVGVGVRSGKHNRASIRGDSFRFAPLHVADGARLRQTETVC